MNAGTTFSGYNVLGQSPIPTTSTCDSGQTSILEMDAIFQSMPPGIQSQFGSAHDAIMQRYNATWYWGIDWIPFNPACSTIYDLGLQADGLTGDMQRAAGQTGVGGPATGANQPWLPSLLGGTQTSLLLIGGLVLLYFVVKR